MEKITTRSCILSAFKMWNNQYSHSKEDDKLIILNHLKSLDLKTVSKKEVDKIIGNTSWTDIKCDECQKYVNCAIVLGEETDYESSTVLICKKCLKLAQKTIRKGA